MRFIAITSLFLSTSVFAICPNLTGKYATCRSLSGNEAGSSDMNVTQVDQGRVTTFSFSFINNETQANINETYKADGKLVSEEITDPDNHITLKTTTLTSCTNSALKIDSKMYLMDQLAGYMTINVSKKGKQLMIESISNDGEQNYKETQICE